MNPFEARLERTWLLIEQDRYDLAEQEARLLVAEEPDHPLAHASLAKALSCLQKHQEAHEAAATAVGLAPDLGFTHYIHSIVLAKGNCLTEAEQAIRQAIELEPCAKFFARLGAILVQRKMWSEAVEAARKGLELEPDHTGCRNVEGLALRQAGKRIEATQSIQGSLERDPVNPWTHANLGWVLLEEGNHRKALEHFREALRLDPGNEYARQGIIAAMKSRSIIYKPLLAYLQWASKLATKHQVLMIVGFFLLSRFAAGIARENPELALVIMPLLLLYLLFVLTTWLGDDLFCLLLFLNRFGRLTLSPEEKKTSILIGILLTAAILLFLFPIVPGDINAGMGVLLATLPFSVTYKVDAGWPRVAVVAMGVLVAVMAVGPSIVYFFFEGRVLPEFAGKALVGFVAFSVKNLYLVAIGSQILSQILVARRTRLITVSRRLGE